MKIIESFLCGKENNPSTCEDGIFISENLVAVIDGVTSKGKRIFNGHKSGYYAKELLLSYLQRGVEQQYTKELLSNLDKVLQNGVSGLEIEEYPRASIILYNDLYKEIWVYGDCQCSINGKVYTHTKRIDELNAMLRAYYLEYYLLNGVSIEELKENDLGRNAISKNLIQQFAFENKTGYFGYPVLNGMGINESMIGVYSVSIGDEIILASDGYPMLKETIAESEVALQEILQEDPMCFRQYRFTKGVKVGNSSFDDRAFCRFIV